VVEILYYYGIMQWVVMKLGWFIHVSMGTTVCESVNAAASVFLGMVSGIILCTATRTQLHRARFVFVGMNIHI
jgi:nucleoside permease NupC